ncbi:PREDICTED: uncharacterized protein LOC107169387 [Diuraphis noxia]|uniref:uncharacterized protein LOC107169387 n=1 Tax=Diuraphis noxia TaxID=143948 RepID=UPI0007636469|nr:PREDICTED: uncharacterized protein LOC107169387 [Diuraphis noxia]
MANQNDFDVKSLEPNKDNNLNTKKTKENDNETSDDHPSVPVSSFKTSENDFDNVDSLQKFFDEEVTPASTLKNNKQLYCYDRETAKTLMYLIDSRDRQKVSSWIRKLDKMNDKDGILERVVYIKYLVATLSGSLGLVEPFTSMPPEKVKPLQMILPPSVYADLVKDDPEPVVRKKIYAHKLQNSNSLLLQDKKFYEQQLFPPEGIICYAAAFSII